jgi:hypothetical protein
METTMDDVERVARALRDAVLNDGEGNTYRLFDLFDFSGENKAHIVTNALASAAMRATRLIDAKALLAEHEAGTKLRLHEVFDWLQCRAGDNNER